MDLFEPSGRGVKLTLGGRAFLERAKSILATVEAAVLAAREATNGSIGTIVIGFAPGPAYLGALSMIVAKLRERQPYVTVKLRSMTSTEQWEALRVGEIALAYSNYVPTDSSFRSVVLAHTKIGMLLPSDHRLAQKHKLRVADLAKERILMAPRAPLPAIARRHHCGRARAWRGAGPGAGTIGPQSDLDARSKRPRPHVRRACAGPVFSMVGEQGMVQGPRRSARRCGARSVISV